MLSQLPSYRNFKSLVKQDHLFTLGKLKDTEQSSNTEQRERKNLEIVITTWSYLGHIHRYQSYSYSEPTISMLWVKEAKCQMISLGQRMWWEEGTMDLKWLCQTGNWELRLRTMALCQNDAEVKSELGL